MTKNFKVIIDTNVWISFLIGKKLKTLLPLLTSSKITLIVCNQLVKEIELATGRKSLKKYFSKNKVEELIKLLKLIGITYEVSNIPDVCRDPKDNFLLGLIEVSKADYLITGDKDLLTLNPYNHRNLDSFRF